MLVVYANTVGAPRLLLDVLRAVHADRVLSYKTHRAYRERLGVPLVDDYDAEEERTRLNAMLQALDSDGGPDHGLIRVGHASGLAQLDQALGGGMTDPGEWEPAQGLEGIVIEPVFPSASESKRLKRALGDAVSSGDRDAIEDAENDIMQAGLHSVGGLTVAGVDGKESVISLTEYELEAFRACGLHVWLLSAIYHLWSLDRGKAYRSGVAQQAT